MTASVRNEPPTPAWVDNHLMLNALALLRHRLVAGNAGSLELMDAITGYFSVGLYIQQRGGTAPIERFVDWLECMAVLRGAVDPNGKRWNVTIDVDEAPGPVPLNALATIATAAFDLTAPGKDWTLAWRSAGPALTLVVRPRAPELARVLRSGPYRAFIALDEAEGSLTCQVTPEDC